MISLLTLVLLCAAPANGTERLPAAMKKHGLIPERPASAKPTSK